MPFSAQAQFVDLYSIPSSEIDVNQILQTKKKYEKQSIPAFQASNQITVEQYGFYLKCIQYDSSAEFFTSQIPNFNNLKGLNPDTYFSDPELQKEPVMGVSWNQARNFCIWLSDIYHIKSDEAYFRLPTVIEWMAINEQNNNSAIRINQDLSDWTISAYDESVYEYAFANGFNSYVYLALPEDPPSMKRKRVMGNNFKYSLPTPADHYRLYCYEDTSYAYVGFRVIKSKEFTFFSKNITETQSVSTAIDSSMGNYFEYEHDNGVFHGSFIQKNKNEMTISGYFRNNQRHGLWTIKDKSDKLVLARLYINNLRYIALFPNHSPNKSSYIIEHQQFDDKIDINGIRLFDYVAEANVLYSKRLWRIIQNKDNDLLNDSIDIFNYLMEYAESGELIVYHSSNDQFTTPLQSKDLNEINAANYVVDGFEIKEDFFLDRKRILGDIRIIGFAPYYINPKTNQRVNICWFYYPTCRKYLSELKLNNTGLYKIENVDDLFYWRFFRSTIIKESNVYDRETSPVTAKLELVLLAKEHEMWINFNR